MTETILSICIPLITGVVAYMVQKVAKATTKLKLEQATLNARESAVKHNQQVTETVILIMEAVERWGLNMELSGKKPSASDKIKKAREYSKKLIPQLKPAKLEVLIDAFMASREDNWDLNKTALAEKLKSKKIASDAIREALSE